MCPGALGAGRRVAVQEEQRGVAGGLQAEAEALPALHVGVEAQRFVEGAQVLQQEVLRWPLGAAVQGHRARPDHEALIRVGSGRQHLEEDRKLYLNSEQQY